MLQMKIILKTLQVYFEPGKLDGRAEQSVIVFTYTKKLGPRFTQLVGCPQTLVHTAFIYYFLWVDAHLA